MRRFFRCLSSAVLLALASCYSSINDSGGSLRARAGDDLEVEQGQSAQLTAHASGGRSPYLYRWSQNSGTDIGIENALQQSAQTAVLEEQGRYVFRLAVTDAMNNHAEDFVVVNVVTPTPPADELSVIISGPGSLQTLEPGSYEAGVSENMGEVSYLWEIVSGDAQLGDLFAQTTTVTPAAGFEGTVTLRVTVTDAGNGETASDEQAISVEIGEFSLTLDVPTTGEAGELTQVTAIAAGAAAPVDYDWMLVSGSGGAGMGTHNCPSVWVSTRGVGTVVLRVSVLDRDTQDVLGTAEASIDFVEAVPEHAFSVTLSRDPVLSAPNEPVTLSAAIEGEVSNPVYAWSIVSGAGTLDDPAAASPILTPTALGTVHVRLALTAIGDNGEETVEEDVYVTTIDAPNPEVIIEIADFGQIRAQLASDAAPLTVANFLSYVDEAFYDGLIMHRTEPDEGLYPVARIEGGGFNQRFEQIEPHPAIPSELDNGLEHFRGTLGASRTTDAANGVISWFFINNIDNDHPLVEGASEPLAGIGVFGTVLEGMDVADAISQVETAEQCGDYRFDFAFAPIEPVIITSIRRVPPETPGDAGG